MTSRYYSGDTFLTLGSTISLPADEARHLVKTMRGHVGDRVVVFGNGVQFAGEVTGISGGQPFIKLDEQIAGASAPKVSMVFLLPWIKGGKTEFLVQKLTELGVDEIIVFHAKREVARGDDSKLDRLTRVAIEACKQCERIDVPIIRTASSLKKARESVANVLDGSAFLLHERTENLFGSELKKLSSMPEKVVFASGPEGGWHPDELEEVVGDFIHVSLGPRILRAETAPLVAAAAVLAMSGEL